MRRHSGNHRRHPSNGSSSSNGGGNGDQLHAPPSPHWLPINPPMDHAHAQLPLHECSIVATDDSLKSYDPTDIHLGREARMAEIRINLASHWET